MVCTPLNPELNPLSDPNQSLPANVSSPDRLINVPFNLEYPDFPAWGLLERAATIVPDRVAANLFGTELTYSQVNLAATRLANWLQHNGLRAGDRVGVLLPNMPEYLIAINGVWLAGGVVLALSPLSTSNELARLLIDTDCRTVISLDALTELLSDADNLETTLLVSISDYLPVWKRASYAAIKWAGLDPSSHPPHANQHLMWDAIKSSVPDVQAVQIVPRHYPAFILRTGGTIDDPRIVTLSHRNIVANAWQQMHWAGATVGELTLLAVIPFFHCYGMSANLAAGVALGATLILQPRFDPVRVLAAIERHRPTLVHTVPAMLVALNKRLRRHSADLSSLKWVISGGAPLPNSIAQEFSRHTPAAIIEGYGLSEASPVTHVGPPNGNHRLGTIGFPLPDTECRIVDIETGTLDVPIGNVGELLIRGPQVMLGYWNNPQATRDILRNGWLCTGDLATVDSSGFYRIVGRKKNLIITSGFNVYPADVEEVIRQHESVQDVAVVGMPDDERGEIVTALVILKSGFPWEPGALGQFCKMHLAAHRRPRLWEQVAKLPQKIIGQTLRHQLLESTQEDSHAKSAGTANSTPTNGAP